MYNIHDTVLYGLHGVCRITDIVMRRLDGKETLYYVLQPVYEESATLYIPADNQKLTAKMKRVLSPDEIYSLIRTMPDEDLLWIENDVERRDVYQKMIRSGDRCDLVRLIRAMYKKQVERKEQNRKLHLADEKLMHEAEKVLHEEFAYVLNIKREQVVPFIAEQVRVEERERKMR